MFAQQPQSNARTLPYWHFVSQTRAQLQDVNYIMSLENPLRGQVAGRVCHADRETAARRIVEQTHRLATKDEIEMFHLEMEQRNQECAEIETRKKLEKGGLVTVLSNEAANKYGIATQPGVTPSGDARKGKV